MGFEVLHADWPTYPIGHGLKNALSEFAEFPSDTKFFPIDNIDECTLFIANEIPSTNKNRFDKNYYHVAVWDEDIQKLTQNSFINAISIIDNRIEFHDGYLSLSDKGKQAILVYELTYGIDSSIMERVEKFLFEKQYDTAIREAAILVETRLRELSKSHEYGQKLIDKCFDESSTVLSTDIPNSSRLVIRATFRRFFKYVRNDFAHNFSSISLVTTCRLLRHCSKLLDLIDRINS